MALPFIAGLALGAGVVYTVSKSDKIKKSACSLAQKSKDVASSTFEKGKEAVADVKNTISATTECIKEKKEKPALEVKE